MSFVSIEFVVLITLVLFLMWIFNKDSYRKVILLTASCMFYAYWDWRFLGLLATVTLLDYYISRFMVSNNTASRRKLLLCTSIVVNLGFLGFFKYFNFFIDSLNFLAGPLGWHLGTMNILLPIGISFYTFETLSYVIDVYKGVTQPAKSLLDYAIFITFFPRLVAGPIMRATQFLPQLERKLTLNFANFITGLQLFLRGLLKKLVIADNLAFMVDKIYASPDIFSTYTVWLAVAAYSFQILCDFSGYTDMARGIAKILGFDLPHNFNLPYTAQSFSEFWSRWHISLSTWLRDYLYIPLGGNRKGKARTTINLLVTMLLGGLWHGASWNFVVWGGLHGIYQSIERGILGHRAEQASWKTPIAWVRAFFVFLLTTLTWVPFRSPNWATTLAVFRKLFFIGGGYSIQWYFVWAVALVPLLWIGGCLSQRLKLTWPIFSSQRSYTFAVIVFEALIVYFFAALNASPFIYFQF